MGFEVTPIAVVESTLTDPAEAPKQGREGAPDAWLVFERDVLDGLDGVGVGDQVILLTWFDRASRDVLRVHPRDDLTNPMRGVFATRSSDRPNPIGLHEVEVLELDGNPYYEWIVEGLRLYEALEQQPCEVIECFPTASWTRWHGPRDGRSRADWSSECLKLLGLDGVPTRLNQDQRDAIAAALTARAHEEGRAELFGEIVVPALRSPA